MTEHRETRDPGESRRNVVVAAVVVLSLLGAVVWTLFMGFAGLLAYEGGNITRTQLVGMSFYVVPVWVIVILLIGLVIRWEKRHRRRGG